MNNTPELHSITDIASLLRWRAEVLAAVFGNEPDIQLMQANERYYAENIPDRHYALEARINGESAGCGAVCIGSELPSPDNPSGRCAYIMNIYTRPEYRSRGVARAIVRALVDWSRAHQCDKIYLETTDMARPLYSAMGFHPLPDIMKLQ